MWLVGDCKHETKSPIVETKSFFERAGIENVVERTNVLKERVDLIKRKIPFENLSAEECEKMFKIDLNEDDAKEDLKTNLKEEILNARSDLNKTE
jgi:hypothetical protein